VAATEVFLGNGHYRLVRPIDEGAPERYLAEDLDGGGLVSLVSLRCSALGRAGTEEFLHRTAGLAGLSATNPGVARVRGSGRDDDRVFLVVEEPKGRRLDDVLAHDQRLEIEAALRITRRVAEVLEVAHSLGVIHGTLMPAAVTVDEGDALVVDGFEIAIVRDCLTPSTMDAAAQAVGGGRAAERADVRALGGLLYQLVTGVAPDRSGFVPARRIRRDVPPDLDRLISSTLGHAVADVPDLACVLNDLHAAGRRPAAPSGARRAARAALIVGAATALGIAGVPALRLLAPSPGGSPSVAIPSTSPASPLAQPAAWPASKHVRAEDVLAPSPAAGPTSPAASSKTSLKGRDAASLGSPVPASDGGPGTAGKPEGPRRPSRESPAASPTARSPAAFPTAKSPAPSAVAPPPVASTVPETEGAAFGAPARPPRGDAEAEDSGAVIDWLLRSRAGGG
jgi:serine/threonine protein kinase